MYNFYCKLWNNKFFSTVITCEEPDVPAGSYVVGYDFNVHSTIEYHCEVGHILRGDSIHICTREGDWSGTTPTCECKHFCLFLQVLYI